MPRHVAFLRGVMPTNARMPELKRCFEEAGFTDVRTVLGSGNVVFNARTGSEATFERRSEAAMRKRLGRVFPAMVRSVEDLCALLDSEPFAAFRLSAEARKVVTFLREVPAGKLSFPIEMEGARILAIRGREALSAYVRLPTTRGPAFMTLIEKTFGKGVTTRTWETLKKCSVA